MKGGLEEKVLYVRACLCVQKCLQVYMVFHWLLWLKADHVRREVGNSAVCVSIFLSLLTLVLLKHFLILWLSYFPVWYFFCVYYFFLNTWCIYLYNIHVFVLKHFTYWKKNIHWKKYMRSYLVLYWKLFSDKNYGRMLGKIVSEQIPTHLLNKRVC